MAKEWTKEWPTEKGYYWFYGWCFHYRDYPPEIHLVKVTHDGMDNPIHITEGRFLWKAEGAEGKWLIADLPEPPDLFGG